MNMQEDYEQRRREDEEATERLLAEGRVLTERDIENYCQMMWGNLLTFPETHRGQKGMRELFKELQADAKPQLMAVRQRYESQGGVWFRKTG
jgi:hypothetical protein